MRMKLTGKPLGRLLLVSAISASAVLSGAGIAQASPVEPQLSTVDLAKSITDKAGDVLPTDTIISDSQIIVGAVPNPTPGNEASPDAAAIAAVDMNNSVVGKSSESQSLMTILHQGTTSADFKISIPEGFTAEVIPDGSVQLRSTEGNVVVPFVKAPWAVDANGMKVPTSYGISGNTITQTVKAEGATYPIVADPSIQWIPLPVVALYGAQAEQIAKTVASTFVLVPGSACTLAIVGGWMGKAFAAVCSIIGYPGAKAVLESVKNIWQSNSGLQPLGCYGFYLTNAGATPANLPARDCSW